MVRVTWQFGHLTLDRLTFATSLHANRWVRKKIASLPSSCHAKWHTHEVTVMNGAQLHSTFTIETLR